MQWYDGLNSQPPGNNPGQRSGIRRLFAMGCITPVFGVTLLAGLCALGAMIFVPTASLISLDPNATRTPLPALTPTSLPTLTPTAGPVEVAAALPGVDAPAGSQVDGSGSVSVSAPGAIAGQAAPANGNPAIQNNVSGTNPAAGVPAPAGANASANPAVPSPPLFTPTPPPAVGQPGNELVINLPPTVAPRATATPRPTLTPTALPATATPTPTPDNILPGDDPEDDNAEEVDAIVEVNDNWSFTGLRTDTSHLQNGMLVYGNLVNHSGSPQDIDLVSATFYDARGNVIDQAHNIEAYWPGYTVPADGATMPFQLLVNGLNGAADFELSLAANSSNSPPREDFDFSDVRQVNQYDSYCLDGYLGNPGSPLQKYLIITAVLYDKKDNVINFQDERVFNPTRVVGDQTYHFKVCVAPPLGNVDHYDLKALGY